MNIMFHNIINVYESILPKWAAMRNRCNKYSCKNNIISLHFTGWLSSIPAKDAITRNGSGDTSTRDCCAKTWSVGGRAFLIPKIDSCGMKSCCFASGSWQWPIWWGYWALRACEYGCIGECVRYGWKEYHFYRKNSPINWCWYN